MAKKNVRAMWAAKIEGRLKEKNPTPESILLKKSFVGTILGIDPSLRGTGIAVVQFGIEHPPKLLHSRTITTHKKSSMPECLAAIHSAVTSSITQFEIDHVAMEQTIYVQNIKTAQILGAARGAAMAAAAVQGLPIAEYPPLRIKQAITGFGRASKEQVSGQVKALLFLKETLPLDESDAAATAICHSYSWQDC